MANILETNVVNYTCACGHLNPITKLYFCRHCLKLRCGFCVCHEVDSHFCCNCLENIPSSEAKLKKNRCNKCFDCPSCQHTLSSRATTVHVPRTSTGDGDKEKGGTASESDKNVKPITRKMYYLSCLACRWTSRDVGLPDQTVATGSWPESEYANATRFSMLMEHYQNVVLQEKQEKQDYLRRKAPKQHKFPSLTDRVGLTVSMIRRQMGYSDKTPTKAKPTSINPSVATDEIEQLLDSIFTENVKLSNVSTLKQRFMQPSTQPATVNLLLPQHKSLSIKRSLRCKQCEHNVIKPEFNPTSIKYRISLFASAHMPEVRLIKCTDIVYGESNVLKFQLKVVNPTLHDMTVAILKLPTVEEEANLIEDLRKSFERQASLTTTAVSSPNSSLLSLSRHQSITAEELRPVKHLVNADIEIPESAFIVNYRDDTAEFDEDIQIKREDPEFIVWRRSNKVAIDLTTKLDYNLLKIGDEVLVGFTMEYTYVNTVVGNTGASSGSAFAGSGDKKEPQKHTLSARIYVRLGCVESKDE